MPEADRRGVGEDEIGALGRLEGVGGQPHLRNGTEDDLKLPGVLERSDQESGLRRLRETLDSLLEQRVEPRRQRDRLRQRLGAAQLPGRQSRRQFDQRQRITSSLREQARADLRGRLAGVFGENVRRRLLFEPTEAQLRQPGRIEPAHVALACGKHNGDAIGAEPSRREHERIRGGAIEPLRIVDQAQHRLLLGRGGDQPEHCGRNEEAIGRRRRRQAERPGERRGLRLRNPVEESEDRPQQSVQPREREIRFRFHARRPQDAHPRRLLCDVAEQRALADAGLAADDERRALAAGGAAEQPLELRALARAAR